MPTFKTEDGLHGFTHRWKDRNGNVKRIKKENKDWGAREVKRQFESFVAELALDNGSCANITFDELYKKSLEHKKKMLKKRATSFIEYVYKIHIKPSFGNVKLAKIDRKMIKDWQKKLLTMTLNDDTLYENSSIIHFQNVFNSILKFGVEEGYMDKNPFNFSTVKRTKDKKKEMDFWTVDEFDKFIAVVDDVVLKVLFRLLFYSGIRKGELLALTVSDYNGYSITINKTYDYSNKIVTTPKTVNSYRTVFLDNVTRTQLDELIDTYKAYYNYSGDTLLFGFDKFINYQTLDRKKNDYCKLAKVKQIRTHDFRHSHVSMLIHNGFNSFEISDRLGHTVTMVNEVYGHLYPNAQQKMVDKINKLNIKNEESDTNMTHTVSPS